MIWACPACHGALRTANGGMRCDMCATDYPVLDGIPDLRMAGGRAWIDIDADRAYAARLLAELGDAPTSAWLHRVFTDQSPQDPARVALRVRQLLAAPERYTGELGGWLREPTGGPGAFVEVGCGAGALLAAAARAGRSGIGIDASLTWLLVARRLIADLGGTPILAAAFADALPLADGAVSGVVSLDVIEHVADPRPYLRELDRVLALGGQLALSTPNRYSLSAEPHVFVWGVGWLPRRWQARYVHWRSGKPYAWVRLLSRRELRSMLATETRVAAEVFAPPVPGEEIAAFTPRRALLARLYNRFATTPLLRAIVRQVGPFFRVLGRKGNVVSSLFMLVLALLAPAVEAQTEAAASAAEDGGAAVVEVVVDATQRHQRLDGFGATTPSLTFDNGRIDNLPAALRRRALETAYREVRLTTGNVPLGAIEWQNDNDDPARFDWERFRIVEGMRVIRDRLVAPAAALGARGLYPSHAIDHRARTWMRELRARDYQRYLDECAEFVLAGIVQWTEATGSEPAFYAPFNEPLSGNGELRGGSVSELIDIVRRAGERLRREGFTKVKFVVPNEETVAETVRVARALLNDRGAGPFIGAIGYHAYPYGAPYVAARRILAGAAAGRRDRTALAERAQLAALGAQYGVPLWLTEVSHADIDPRSMDHLRARAVHVHDELRYTNASAYYGMQAIWDSRTHAEHFAGRHTTGLLAEQDTVVLVDNESQRITITGMGYAIGHYARWAAPGSFRVESRSSDPLLLVSAFHDPARNAAALVLINNAAAARTVRIAWRGDGAGASWNGEQSAGDARWRRLPPLERADGGSLLTLPPLSVTSLGATP